MTTTALTWDKQTNSCQLMPITVIVKKIDGYRSDSGSLKVLGPMGEEMRRSMGIALTLAHHAVAERTKMMPRFDVTVTVPVREAEMYDGASAGLAIYVAGVGAMMNWESNPRVALTGEVGPGGKVIRVGRVRDKMAFAANNDIDMVLIPADSADALIAQGPEQFASPLTILGVRNVSEVVMIGGREDE